MLAIRRGALLGPRELANRMRDTFPIDQAFGARHYPNYFSGQVALALNIARNGYPCEPIDDSILADLDAEVQKDAEHTHTTSEG